MVYPVKDVYVTANFGVPGSWAAGRHTGTDFRASVGTPVHATKGGKVVFSGYGGMGSAYGLHIVIESPTGVPGVRRRVLYAHLSRSFVTWGEKVKAGERIGLSGDTGNTSGPHLHYEERAYPYGYYNYRSPIFLKYKPIRKPLVYLSDFRVGKKSLSARRVKRALNRKFPHGDRLPTNRTWGKDAKAKYARWQKRLGYTGRNANGVPGRESLEKLGFRVRSKR